MVILQLLHGLGTALVGHQSPFTLTGDAPAHSRMKSVGSISCDKGSSTSVL